MHGDVYCRLDLNQIKPVSLTLYAVCIRAQYFVIFDLRGLVKKRR